jgi:hypothetical protein
MRARPLGQCRLYLVCVLLLLLVACDQRTGSEGAESEATSDEPSPTSTSALEVTPTPSIPTVEDNTAVPESVAGDEEWQALLKRSLDLPKEESADGCPVSEIHKRGETLYMGQEPVFAFGYLTSNHPQSYETYSTNEGVAVFKMSWSVDDPEYNDSILIRGQHVGGDYEVQFLRSGDHVRDASDELRLTPDDADERTESGLQWRTSLIVPEPGCYGVQIDGQDFTDVIIFEVAE